MAQPTARSVTAAIRQLKKARQPSSVRDIARLIGSDFGHVFPVLQQLEAERVVIHRNGFWFMA